MVKRLITSEQLKKFDKMTFVGQVQTHLETYEATRQPKAAWEIWISYSNKESKRNKYTNSKGLLNFINLKIQKWFIGGTLKLESNNNSVEPIEVKF